MTGKELVRRVRVVGRQRGVAVRFEPRAGKGGHGRLHFGDRFTTVKDRRKEVGPGLLAAMLRQLGLSREDILARLPSDRRDMFKATGRRSKPGRAVPEAASYASFMKPLCKLDSTVKIGAPQGVQSRHVEDEMVQRLAYPVSLEKQDDGTVLVSFPDIPEALTEGETEDEALTVAEDCLIAALGGYIQARRDVPRPSPARGLALVALPALVAAKTALYREMRAQGIGNTALAKRLGTSEGAVRRLVDPDHRSHIGRIESALRALGQCLVVATRAA